MRVSRPFFVLLAVIALSGCMKEISEDRIQQAGAHYKMGVANLNAGKAQQAFVEFQKAVELNPSDKEALYGIGLVHLLHFDNLQLAVEFFEKAVAVDPNYSEALNGLGYVNQRMGRYELSVQYYRKAVQNLLYATPEKSFIGLGGSLYRLKRYQEAISAYQEAIKRAPDVSLPYLRMSLCLNALGRYGEAAAAMNHALKIDPSIRGDRQKAIDLWESTRLTASGPERQDTNDYIEILRY